MAGMKSNGRTALVTGAGSGVGRAVALALHEAGYAVVLAGRREVELEKTAAAGATGGGKMLVVPTDVSEPEAVKGLFQKTRDECGRLDVLFNNAGMGAVDGGGGRESHGCTPLRAGRLSPDERADAARPTDYQ